MRIALTTLACLVSITACMGENDRSMIPDSTAMGDAATPGAIASGDTGMAAGASVTAPMRDVNGRELGTLTLTESGDAIAVSGTLTGLPPGEHAIHIHMTGSCEPPFTSAGGHWNPTNSQHGTENPQGPHLGDMPNLTVAADSSVSVQVSTPGGTMRGSNALLDDDGAAVVVHAGPDDYRTDPAGNAGDRIACGVVG